MNAEVTNPAGPRVIFFCGDGSPYGRAHLRPVLETFNVVGAVIATAERWMKFRESLSGEKQKRPGLMMRLRRALQRRREGFIDVPKILEASNVTWRRAFDANAPELLGWTSHLKPDIIISAAYPQIFSAGLLAIPGRGAINFHPSLLPRFRGAHPHFWAVATGAATTGVSAHFMTSKIDDGDLIAQIEFPIAELTYSEVYRRIVEQTPALVRDVAAFLSDPGSVAVPQDHTAASFYRNDREEHRRIHWDTQPAEAIRNLCRTERAFCLCRGRKLTLLSATVVRNEREAAERDGGTVVSLADAGMVVKAIDGCVRVAEVQVAQRRMPPMRWAHRAGLRIGDRLN